MSSDGNNCDCSTAMVQYVVCITISIHTKSLLTHRWSQSKDYDEHEQHPTKKDIVIRMRSNQYWRFGVEPKKERLNYPNEFLVVGRTAFRCSLYFPWVPVILVFFFSSAFCIYVHSCLHFVQESKARQRSEVKSRTDDGRTRKKNHWCRVSFFFLSEHFLLRSAECKSILVRLFVVCKRTIHITLSGCVHCGMLWGKWAVCEKLTGSNMRAKEKLLHYSHTNSIVSVIGS